MQLAYAPILVAAGRAEDFFDFVARCLTYYFRAAGVAASAVFPIYFPALCMEAYRCERADFLREVAQSYRFRLGKGIVADAVLAAAPYRV